MRRLFLVLGALLFALKGVVFFDPDFGWHLRTGQLILQSGIPAKDPFSYTMPNFPYVDHAWLTDTAIAVLFPRIGYFGLALIFALLTTCALLISLSLVKGKNNFWLPLSLLAGTVVISFVSVRPQILTLFFFSAELWILFKNERFKWLLPPFFLLWANLHGGFPIGLAALFLTGNWLIGLLSTLATLVNPYGLGLWREILTTVSDRSLFFGVQEWIPPIFRFDPAFAVLLVLSLTSIIKYRSKFAWGKVALYLFLLATVLSASRHLPLWILVALPISISGMNFLYDERQSNKQVMVRFWRATKFFTVGAICLSVLELVLSFRSAADYRETNFYPRGAVVYLRSHPRAGEIFSEYDWGGYLIWKLPQKKVFVDGRMPIWQQDNYSAFREYQKITSGQGDFQQVFQKYNVQTVLWSNYDESFLTKLKTSGWRETYKDKVAVIYQK
ncbi:hypothetical protein HY440_01350 [Candidatus Microgenomates bacterium]|nr:hypothetical protein [Candidatus Microgenomates bacterium]